jgi:hypothetical protein
MKRDELEEILEDCLRCLENGGSVESCLTRYPEAAEELWTLLLTVQIVKAVPSPSASLAVRELGVAKMLATVDSSFQSKRSGRLKRLGEITMKTTIRFALALVIGVIGVVWFVSFWQQQEGEIDERLEILPPAIETLTVTETPIPPPMDTVTALPVPTNIPTAVFTETPIPPVPTIVSPAPSPTNQPVINDPTPLLPPVDLNDGTILTIVPGNPSTVDTIEIFVAGTGACSAVPVYQSHQIINENVIQIEARKPGRDMACAAVITDWSFNLFLDPLSVGEYRIEFFVSQDETRELWRREFFTVVSLPTAVPTLTCDEKLLAEGQYLILLDKSHFVDGVTENGETVTQVVERLITKYEGMIRFVWETLPGFSVQHLSSDAAAALAAEPEVISVDPNLCVSGAGG